LTPELVVPLEIVVIEMYWNPRVSRVGPFCTVDCAAISRLL
jgi:hypothetical protein